ncbi:hypothetical protein PT7_1846 [Pusillimonas sp. T7-7]|nr:hypothetical protein PT7_1846 [Pusillimonas sp. T7-7]
MQVINKNYVEGEKLQNLPWNDTKRIALVHCGTQGDPGIFIVFFCILTNS